MKMSKRIFVCLIALAIGVSMMAFGASAEGVEGLKYTTENHASILEYYEEPIIFDLDFDGEETVSTGYTNSQLVNVKNAAGTTVKNVASIVETADGKYLNVAGGNNAMGSNPTFLNWNAATGEEIDDFIIEFDIMINGTGKRIVELFVDSAPVDTAGIVATTAPGTSVLKLDFATGVVGYYAGVVDGNVVFNEVAASFAADTFYHVTLNYGVGAGVVTAEITLGDTVVATVTDGAIPTNTVANVRLGSTLANIQKSSFALDNVSASGGSFTRAAADKQPETERAISDFIAICQDPTVAVEDKIPVVNTGLRLISVHNISSDDPTAQANILTFQKVGVGIFVDQLVACVNGAADVVAYDDLVAYLESYEKYSDLIPADLDFMGDAKDAAVAAVAAYEAECAKALAYKTDSEAVLAALAGVEITNTNVRDYGYLKTYYDNLAGRVPYIGYPGVAEIIDDYNSVVTNFERLSANAQAFAANVAIAVDTANTFGARHAAYILARDGYFNDPSYEGIDAILANYATVEAEMVDIIALCDGFIVNVNRADYSQYLSAKQNALNEAATSLDEIKASYTEYPGMANAIALYETLSVKVSEDIAAAEAYVAFVTELAATADSMTKEELKAAIDQALLLQESGNVIGVDGVTEANIIVNNLQADLELTVGYKNQFHNLVTSIENETNYEKLFGLAYDALEAIENANRYEGVDAADQAKLDAKIAEYNAKIQALNAGFAEANDVACNTVSASSGSASDDASVGKVIALVKKFYE